MLWREGHREPRAACEHLGAGGAASARAATVAASRAPQHTDSA